MKNIIVHLNCHTHPIAAALSDVFPDSEYNIVKVINFQKQPISEALLQNCHIYIYQYIEGEHWGKYNSEFFLKLLPSRCICIRYPIIRLNPFWPFNTKNGFLTDKKEIKKSQKFPNGDKFLISKRNQYNSAKELAEEYLRQDIHSLVNLDYEFQKILNWYDNLRNSMDLNIKQFILSNYKNKLLFHTVDHISDFFLNYMIDHIFCLLEIEKNKNYTCKFMSENNIPIHPSVINYFNLSFVNDNQVYLYNGEYVSALQYYINYILDLYALES